ncbi:hypothetical protein SDC9_157761 [bioreactor metagenome]|uniref:Uncharacterized protein n=1 Tax=bioreactor metagenome TaxID=1076179 RepID=A0A645FA20_9ZZZZ
MGKPDVADDGAGSFRRRNPLVEHDLQRKEPSRLRNEIADGNILDHTPGRIPAVTRNKGNRRGAVMDDDIVDQAVADRSAADADPDGIGEAASQYAAGDDHVFADRRIVQLGVGSAQSDRVVRRIDDAVSDNHVVARIDIDSVAVQKMMAPGNMDSVQPDISAPVEKQMPIGRVNKRHPFHADFFALPEKEHLGRTLRIEVRKEILPPADRVQRHPSARVAVDPAAGNGDVPFPYGNQKMSCGNVFRR